MVKLFSAGGPKIFVGLLSLAVTAGFSAIALADGLLLIKVKMNDKKERKSPHQPVLFVFRFTVCTDRAARLSNKPNKNSNRLSSTSLDRFFSPICEQKKRTVLFFSFKSDGSRCRARSDSGRSERDVSLVGSTTTTDEQLSSTKFVSKISLTANSSMLVSFFWSFDVD